jgi:hypothetical protein
LPTSGNLEAERSPGSLRSLVVLVDTPAANPVAANVPAVVFVASRAIALARVDSRRRHAAQNVAAVSDRLKVVGVDAVSNPAEMVEHLPCRNRPDEQLVSESVDLVRNSALAKPAVTVAVERLDPEPTATRPTFVNALPKVRGHCWRIVSHVDSNPVGQPRAVIAVSGHSYHFNVVAAQGIPSRLIRGSEAWVPSGAQV